MQTKGKFVFAFFYAVAVAAVPIFSGDNPRPSAEEWVQIGVAVCTAALVYIVPLVPSAPWTKTAIGAVLAGLQVLVTLVVGGVDANDVLMVAFAVASFLGITVTPAESPKTATAVGWGSDTPTRYAAA